MEDGELRKKGGAFSAFLTYLTILSLRTLLCSAGWTYGTIPRRCTHDLTYVSNLLYHSCFETPNPLHGHPTLKLSRRFV